jgi:hypothetical protein
VPYVPTAQFILPTAYRTNLSGVIIAPITLMWERREKIAALAGTSSLRRRRMIAYDRPAPVLDHRRDGGGRVRGVLAAVPDSGRPGRDHRR